MKSSPLSILILTAALAALPHVGPAADTPAAAAEGQLAAAVKELAALRETIAKEKLPVAAELRTLETKLLEKRRERERLQRLRDNSGVELGTLQSGLEVRTKELEYAGNVLNDYANRLHAALHPAEVHLYTEQLVKILNVSEATGLTPLARLETQVESFQVGTERLRENSGGRIFSGSAVLPDGGFEAGKFALLGPVGLFATSNGSMAGLAERGTATGPRMVVFNQDATPALAALVQEGSGAVPIDPTNGRAIAMAATEETLIEHIQKGGIWMYPILGFAFAALGMGVLKFAQIAGYKLPPPGTVSGILEHLQAGNGGEAERLAKSKAGPAGAMLLEGVRHSRMPKELLDELMFEKMLEVKPVLERGLAMISITAAVAPLLGLLGTVTGMINTFKAITVFGTGDAKSLSSGISEALITTEYGLIVAIPALLLSAYLSRRVNGFLSGMERMSINFVNGVSVLRESRDSVAARETVSANAA